MKKLVPIEKEHYSRLCSTGTHINPVTKPQPYNPMTVPTVGAVFQELGFFVALNELAIATAVVGGSLVRIIDIDGAIKTEIQQAALDTAKQAGSLSTANMHTVWEEMQKKGIAI